MRCFAHLRGAPPNPSQPIHTMTTLRCQCVMGKGRQPLSPPHAEAAGAPSALNRTHQKRIRRCIPIPTETVSWGPE